MPAADPQEYHILDQFHSQPGRLKIIHVGAGACGLLFAYKTRKLLTNVELICYEKLVSLESPFLILANVFVIESGSRSPDALSNKVSLVLCCVACHPFCAFLGRGCLYLDVCARNALPFRRRLTSSRILSSSSILNSHHRRWREICADINAPKLMFHA